MAEGSAPDDVSFNQLNYTVNELEEKVNEAIEKVLGNEIYNEARVRHWINEICENVMRSLHEAHKPFKYMVTCLIM